MNTAKDGIGGIRKYLTNLSHCVILNVLNNGESHDSLG